ALCVDWQSTTSPSSTCPSQLHCTRSYCERLGLDDLTDLDPQLTRSLRDLLEYKGGDEEEVYGLDFTLTQDYFGECKSVPLKAGGEEMSVTQQNNVATVTVVVGMIQMRELEFTGVYMYTSFTIIGGHFTMSDA
ncbi:hypothetical protein O3P69_018343, partial [Scylla paramamosain]